MALMGREASLGIIQKDLLACGYSKLPVLGRGRMSPKQYGRATAHMQLPRMAFFPACGSYSKQLPHLDMPPMILIGVATVNDAELLYKALELIVE